MAPTATQYVVVILGSFLGAWSKGLTGFGSAILAVFIWVLFETCGLNPGALQTVVVADCMNSLAAAAPMWIMTEAHKTADWRIVCTLIVFKSAMAPLGAALLVALPKHLLEFITGCVMVVVMLVSAPGLPVLLSDAKAALGRRLRHMSKARHTADLIWAAPLEAPTHKADEQQPADLESLLPADSQISSSCSSASNMAAKEQAEGGCSICDGADHKLSAAEEGTAGITADRPASIVAIDLLCSPDQGAAKPVCTPQSKAIEVQAVAKTSRQHPCNELLDCHSDSGRQSEADKDFADVPLLTVGQSSSSDPADAVSASCPPEAPTVGLRQRAVTFIKSMPSKARVFLRDPENKTVVTWGSVCGAASGVMEGMTGMGGPPVMFLYLKLKTSKDVARGTGSVLTLLQSRLIAYFVMGLVKREDLLLYGVTAAQHVVVTVFASKVSKYVSQAWFGRTLLLLMTLCTILLFTAAAGIQGGGNHASSS